MARAAASDAPDRFRYPFVSPAEKAAMHADLRREQSADSFDNRAPLALDVGDGTGFLGVPRRGAADRAASRSPRIRISTNSQSASVRVGEPSAPPAVERPPAALVETAESQVARTAEVSASDESEEMRRIRRWLAEEVGRIENVLVSHLGRGAEPSVEVDVEAGASAVDLAPPAGERSAPLENAQPAYRHPSWPSAAVDLDEARDQRLASLVEPGAEPYDPVAARAAVPAQFVPKRGRSDDEDGSLRPSGLRLSRPAPSESAGRDDVPAFLRDASLPLKGQTSQAPVLRPARNDRPSGTPARGTGGGVQLDPVPPIRPSQPRGMPPARVPGSQSTWGALILAYAVFILIPVTEWMSGTLDPRIGAVVPAVTFFGWLSIHMLRRDQIFQLRILTAWQVAHAVGGLHAIRPWGGTTVPIYWTSAAIAVGCALVVVAISAVVEACEYRAGRTPSGLSLPPSRRLSGDPRETASRVPAE